MSTWNVLAFLLDELAKLGFKLFSLSEFDFKTMFSMSFSTIFVKKYYNLHIMAKCNKFI